MTRINCVPPQELSRQHLVAEWRELPRVFRLANNAAARGSILRDAPQHYTLGAGHVKFFYDKLGFIQRRWQALRVEMLARGYAPGYERPPIEGVPAELFGEWEPDSAALSINRARIAERSPK